MRNGILPIAFWLTILIVILLGWISCPKRVYQLANPTLRDGLYDSEFPYRNCSKELRAIGETIKLINSIAYYESYVFDESSRVREFMLNPTFIEQHARRVIYYNNSTSGTATVILHQDRRLALLTCAHIVDFPDTVLSYFPTEQGRIGFYVQSVAVKERQSNYVADLRDVSELDIIEIDQEADIALLGAVSPVETDFPIPVFHYPLGSARQLEWGSFIYLIGFPRGYKMITRGIVSDPNRNKRGDFLIDALFNKGCSGGLVLAVRDGVPNFELVGIARSAAAEFDYVIRPSKQFDISKHDIHLPYRDELFPDQTATIQYGVTHVVPIEAIVDFIRGCRRGLAEKGYDFSEFLSEEKP